MTKKIILVSVLALTTIFIAGCSDNKSETVVKSQVAQTNTSSEVKFSGKIGDSVTIDSDKVIIDSTILDDNMAHFFNTKLSDGETVYFFVVKDKNGIYRAAGNACQVCSESKMGFEQQGNFMVCNTCGNKYPMEKIATEKGGCNPVPVNPNLKSVNGKIEIKESDLKQLKGFF